MKSKAPDVVYSPQEREEILAKMRAASNAFYSAAVQAKCHQFIEMTGVMNEFIKVCQDAHNDGIDFTQASTHTGHALPIKTYNAAYLAEKLNCIYGPSLLASAEVRNAFISTLLDGRFKLVKAEAVASDEEDPYELLLP